MLDASLMINDRLESFAEKALKKRLLFLILEKKGSLNRGEFEM